LGLGLGSVWGLREAKPTRQPQGHTHRNFPTHRDVRTVGVWGLGPQKKCEVPALSAVCADNAGTQNVAPKGFEPSLPP
jgi:hypothetical protein